MKKDINNEYKIVSRKAVRAVIFKDGKLLMISTNLGDYKLPGGGVKPDEDMKEALIREIEEETGFKVEAVNDRIGIVIQRNLDKFEENAVFEMTSNYYLCQVSDIQVGQNLDDYEAEQGFKSVWVTIDEAITNNKSVLKEGKSNMNDWVSRENLVLQEIKKIVE